MIDTLLNTVEERLTSLPEEKVIRRHTRWIALQSTVPIINTIFGVYINPHCHILESYDQKHINKIKK